MKIELLKHYGMSAPGDILTDVNPPVAKLLIQRKVAKKVVVKRKSKKCSNTK